MNTHLDQHVQCRVPGCHTVHEDKHVLYHHMFEHWPWSVCPYVCTYCQQGFSERFKLGAHTRDRHHVQNLTEAITAGTPQLTPENIKAAGAIWIESAYRDGRLDQAHYTRLRAKCTLITTDNISELERHAQYSPTNPSFGGTIHNTVTPTMDENLTAQILEKCSTAIEPVSPLSRTPHHQYQQGQGGLLMPAQASQYGAPPPVFFNGNASCTPLKVSVPVTSKIPLGKSAPAATPLPKPPKSHTGKIMAISHHQRTLPSPKRQRKTSTLSSNNPSVEAAVRDAATPVQQNIELARGMDRLFPTLHELGKKIQQKSAEVCVDQTQDLVRQLTTSIRRSHGDARIR